MGRCRIDGRMAARRWRDAVPRCQSRRSRGSAKRRPRRRDHLQLARDGRDGRMAATVVGPLAHPASRSGGRHVNAIPRATYRVQLNRNFDFRAARAIVPYLARLGITHLYTSPFLKARPDSLHGYDIIDHGALNPEIGTADDFEALVQELKRRRVGLMIDVVPNHMGVCQADNRWWLDVLENGPASRYAGYFDIEWQPLSDELRGKVLLPILGDQYGTVLERAELKLAFDGDAGTFSLWYFEHRLPIRPSTYSTIIACEEQRGDGDESASTDIATMSEAFAALDATDPTIDPAAQSAPLKARLAA